MEQKLKKESVKKNNTKKLKKTIKPKKKITNNLKIDNLINNKLAQDEKSELLEIINQIKKIFVNRFWSNTGFDVFVDVVSNAKPKFYQKIINQISQISFTDEEFSEVIQLVQTYRNIKNNTPEQRKSWEILSSIMQLFLQEISENIAPQEIAKMWNKIQNLFNERLERPNELLENEKPYDILKEYFPDQDFKKIGIKWAFI